jgi:hypothetical protein
MDVDRPIWKAKSRRRACLALVVFAAQCAIPLSVAWADRIATDADIDPAARRSVRAVEVPSDNLDGQTSWIIEPDVPRIPKVAGLDTQLPPHIQQRMSYAFDLAQRGATYSASAEFHAVLSLCALELDSRDGGTTHREALRLGLTALEEADDFGGENIDWRDANDVQRTAASHSTPVLHQDPPPKVDAIQAAQAYYTFAEERLAYSCQGMPSASLAFYGLGRTCVFAGPHVAHAAGKAAVFQRVALDVAPQNVLAGNELGVLLADHGHLAEAEKTFQQCVATEATPEAWRNLAVVYSREGKHEECRSAIAACDALNAKRHAPVGPIADAAAANHTNLVSSGTGTTALEAENDQQQPTGIMAKLNNVTSKIPNPFRR